ncbi:hypothetical protein HU200_020371 [Digitaria exilis]|uniref:BHLH domain-containing protein n=1 Tax=Digitaria exilis TaxID=1010633 RepID=A0A835KEL9_9POAL|nr:hypothetical protein HU200_020371 [Digitaria exilis]
MFMQWAMDTLLSEHPEPAVSFVDDARGGETTFPSLQALRDASHAVEMVRELMADDEALAANSWSSGDGDVTDGSGGGGAGGGVTSSPGSFRRAPPPAASSSTNPPPMSWNFVTGSAQPGSGANIVEEAVVAPRSVPPELVPGSPPTRRPSLKSLGAASSASAYAPDHIIAERKRREKINKRLIELSTVIPGLKKMDKATILSDAAKYVKELQQRLKDLELEVAAARSNETGARAKKPCNNNAVVAAAPDENGSPSSASSGTPVVRPPALPEIQARFSEKSAMVRVHCRSGKGVAQTVLSEVEELGLSVVHANVMPFSAGTVLITITTKVEGFTVTAEEIVGRLNSALSHQHSSCNKGTEETAGN